MSESNFFSWSTFFRIIELPTQLQNSVSRIDTSRNKQIESGHLSMTAKSKTKKFKNISL